MRCTPSEISRVLEPLGLCVSKGWFFRDKRKDGSTRLKFSLGRIDKLPGWTPPNEELYEEARLLLQQELEIPLKVSGSCLIGIIPPD